MVVYVCDNCVRGRECGINFYIVINNDDDDDFSITQTVITPSYYGLGHSYVYVCMYVCDRRS